MNISTADFDWISLLLVVGAGVIGLVKSMNSKKVEQRPVFQQPDLSENEEEDIINVEEVTLPVFHTEEYHEEAQEQVSLTDYYRDPKLSLEKQTEALPIEHEEEEKVYFDIRQAIISSEILKRPQF